MSIKALKKITLWGLSSEKEELLRGLQSLGCMHLIPLRQSEETFGEQSEVQSAKDALHWLTSCPMRRRETRRSGELTANDIVNKVQANKLEHRQTADKRDALIKRIREVQPWGEFNFAPLRAMASIRLWFYVVPLKEMIAVEALELPYEVVHQDNKDAYVVVLSKQEPSTDILPIKRSHVGKHSLDELQIRLEEAEIALEDIQSERETLTRWVYIISQAIARFQDEQTLQEVASATLEEDQFFLVSGWMPEDREQDIRLFVDQKLAAVTFEEPTDEDAPPTLLESSLRTGGGSEAFSFFQVPGYRSWDPGNMVFYSFSLFFAMIMSDAAYCAILFGIFLMFHKKMGQTEGGRRLLNMGYFMSTLGMLWGVMIGSYFGVAPEPNSVLDKLAFINMNDYNAMMTLSIVVGVAHLIIANFMNYWINRHKTTSYAHLGWSATMLGGVFMYLGKIGYIFALLGTTLGWLMIIGGIGTVFWFSSERPYATTKGKILRTLDGLKAIYNITGAFGDVLSYMRLFALGLSGASLAMTFNNLAKDALDSSPVTGVLFAGVILLLGHVLNFALCIMSGVVHGMRLNVIEFVNWGMSDEGYPFKAFRKQED